MIIRHWRHHESRLVCSMFHRRLLPGGRHRNARAARAVRLRRRLPARPDLLRPADGATAAATTNAPPPRRCSCGTSPASTTSSRRPAAASTTCATISTRIEQTAEVKEVRARTYELVEFLHDVLKVDAFPWAEFPHQVGLHNSCGTLRALAHCEDVGDWTSRSSRSRWTCCRRSRASSSSRRRGRTSAAASAAPSPCSRSPSRPRWATTR